MTGVGSSELGSSGARTESPVMEDDVAQDVESGKRHAVTTSDDVYPRGIQLAVLVLAVFVTMFLVALITDDFQSVADIGWYGSAYLLTNCAFQLLFGKIYSFFSVKFSFLSAILLFEIGSAICGAAPNSVAFIFDRAVAGLGSAGIMSGTLIIVHAIPLRKRPMYQGIFGAVFGLSLIIGPLLGGVFTTEVTWQWCFYVSLPFGGVAVVIVYLLLNISDRGSTNLPLESKVFQLELLGTGAFIPGVACLLLALQWGGSTYAWSSWRVILLLTLSAILITIFAVIQILKPETATVPPRTFVQRSILAGLFSTLCIGSQMMIFIYFLPVWFHAIKGLSAIDSGIQLLPLVLAMVVSSVVTGVLTSHVGYYTLFLTLGVCHMAVGADLLTTLQVDSEERQCIGYQVLFGWGLGNSFQAPNLAAQTVLPTDDVPIGTSLMLFSQLLGGAVCISGGQNVLGTQLSERLKRVPGFNAIFRNEGATTITHLPESIKPTVGSAYNEALRAVFRVGLIMGCLTILGAVAMEWRSVKKTLEAAENDNMTAEEVFKRERKEARLAGAPVHDTEHEN